MNSAMSLPFASPASSLVRPDIPRLTLKTMSFLATAVLLPVMERAASLEERKKRIIFYFYGKPV